MTSLPERTLDALTKGREGLVFDEDGEFRGADGHAAVDLFALVLCRNALEFEVRTGMKMSRHSALAAANRMLGTNHRTKKRALEHLSAVMDMAKNGSDSEPGANAEPLE